MSNTTFDKLKSGVEHTTGETRNLGELFNEAKKKSKMPKRKRTKKQKIEAAKLKNTGIYHVMKQKGLTYRKKIFFKFTYQDENGKTRTTQRKTLVELYYRVKELGYNFDIIDANQAKSFLNNNCNRQDYEFLCKELCLTDEEVI